MSFSALFLSIFFILLYIGFRYEAWNLSLITIFMLLGLSIAMTGVDIEATKANWAERRCDIDVFMLGFLYKPSEDERSRGEFAYDNLSFCVRHIFRDLLSAMMAPLLAVLGKNIESLSLLGDIFQSLRNLKAQMASSFFKIIEPFYRRFIGVGAAYARNFSRLYSAMKRASGIAMSTLYMTMSLQAAIESWVSFVITVVIVILIVLAALFIILFFPLLPVLWIIIAVVILLTAGGFGGALGGAASVFCFDPETKVKLQNGEIVSLKDCKIGDILHDGTKIEGILQTDGTNERLYSLDGILVSGSHLVWSESRNEWVEVSEIDSAKVVSRTLEKLVCLRTSTRTISVGGDSRHFWKFRDWEELPAELSEADSVWNWLVEIILNKKSNNIKQTYVPKEDPLFGKDCIITKKDGTKVSISSISIGDEIVNESGYTRVVGVYEGEARMRSEKSFSDGVWIIESLVWKHLAEKDINMNNMKGYHIITESGTFIVESEDYSGIVRDFTEVGSDRISLTYGFTRALLKKSPK